MAASGLSAEEAVRISRSLSARSTVLLPVQGSDTSVQANGTNEKLSSALLASRIRMKALIGDTTSESVAQSTGSSSRCRDGQ